MSFKEGPFLSLRYTGRLLMYNRCSGNLLYPVEDGPAGHLSDRRNNILQSNGFYEQFPAGLQLFNLPQRAYEYKYEGGSDLCRPSEAKVRGGGGEKEAEKGRFNTSRLILCRGQCLCPRF